MEDKERGRGRRSFALREAAVTLTKQKQHYTKKASSG